MKDAIIKLASGLLRGLVFAILLFLRPFVTGVFGLLGGLCLIGFLATLVLDRTQGTALLGMFTFGLLSALIVFGYNWLLILLAPSGFTMVMEE